MIDSQPNNESAWVYLKGLFTGTKHLNSAPISIYTVELTKICQPLEENRFALSLYADLCAANKSDECIRIWGLLESKIDAIRIGYWKWKASQYKAIKSK